MIAASYIEYFSMCLHQRVAPNIEHLRIVPSHQAWNTYYVSVCFDEEEKERRWRRSESSFSHHFLHIRHIAWQMKVNKSPVHQWYWNISTLFQAPFFWSIFSRGKEGIRHQPICSAAFQLYALNLESCETSDSIGLFAWDSDILIH